MEQSTSTAAAESPAFLRAVTQLAQQRPVLTSRAIYNHNGIKLLEGGVQVDAGLYDRLLSHRLATPLDESVDSDPSVTGAVLREAAEAAMLRWPFFALLGPAGRVRSMLLQSIEAIPLPRPVALHLTLARETRPAVFEHSVLMALLCAHLVREGGAPIHDMTVAASAGLLHDLGMLHIAAEVLDAGNLLSGDARRPLYAHPLTGSMLIARFHEYPSTIARAILEHHERLDGSGYPRGLAGDAISPLGRLLSLCEVVTAMFDGERKHPELRVSLLLRIGAPRYDPTLVPSIHRLLRALPAPVDAVGASIAESVARLRVLAELLNTWHEVAQAAAPALVPAGRAVLKSMAEQAAALQRMLFEAGITPEQLDFIGASSEPDAPLRTELWALTGELRWNLRASANQLRRRWRAAMSGQPFPAPIAAWLDAIDALDAPA
ncbi:MAG TPA: HD domain-containing phosphohydrolase [Burkholderiaceae bacterium]|nr:HD domain-containing phosphohydrolase [Burkholderiaceae bacterium]